MNNIRLTFVALLVLVCSVSILAAGQPPSYPLVCRGGPEMRIMVNHDVDSAGIPGAAAMFIYFKPAARANSPQPGECVWVDRTFRPGEPAVMWIRAPHVEFAFQVYGDGRVVRDGSGIRLSPEGNSPEAQKWRYLTNGVLDGRQFTAHVYNDNGRVMVITSVGP